MTFSFVSSQGNPKKKYVCFNFSLRLPKKASRKIMDALISLVSSQGNFEEMTDALIVFASSQGSLQKNYGCFDFSRVVPRKLRGNDGCFRQLRENIWMKKAEYVLCTCALVMYRFLFHNFIPDLAQKLLAQMCNGFIRFICPQLDNHCSIYK